MRTMLVVLCGCLLLAPAPVRAEEPPSTQPGDEKPPAKPELASPQAAYSELMSSVRAIPDRTKRDALLKEAAGAYAEKWKASGGKAEGNDLYFLGLILRSAERWAAAADAFRQAQADETTAAPQRAYAAMNEVRLYADAEVRKALGAERVDKALARIAKFAAGMTAEAEAAQRGQIETTIASTLDAMDRKQEARDLRIAVAKRDPLMVGRVYRSLFAGLMGKTHALEGYPKLLAEMEPLLEMLKAQQAKAVVQTQEKLDAAVAALREADPEAVDEGGNLKNTDPRAMSPLERVVYNASRTARGAKSTLTRLDDARKPFEMLGQPAPAWTLEHAFGDTKKLEDLRGKVVVLDFWATWCPWCIRSFPAIRDLLKAYGEKGLVFVGVTASAPSVYEARYDLDDDLKDRAEAGQRPTPTARLARGNQQPDGETIFDAETYPAKEREIITQFIANHEMTWPVVMIDKAEPGPKYALAGWPHAVVVDRAGRIRYFKSGALLRDRPEAVAKFAKIIADLLAEPAAKKE